MSSLVLVTDRVEERKQTRATLILKAFLALWLVLPFSLWAYGSWSDQRSENEAIRTARTGTALIVQAWDNPAELMFCGIGWMWWSHHAPASRTIVLQIDGKQGAYIVSPSAASVTAVGAHLVIRYQTDQHPGWMKVWSVSLPPPGEG